MRNLILPCGVPCAIKRTRFLIGAIVVLVAVNLAWRISRDWGLITIHANDQPLSEVMRQIEKKGGVHLRTNLDTTMPITLQAEIAKLPAKERDKAEVQFAERKALFEGLRNLLPEERRAKMEEIMSSPEAQDRMDRGQGRRDALRTPQQRADRYRNYLEQKQSAMNR